MSHTDAEPVIVCEAFLVLCISCCEFVWDAVAIPVGDEGHFLCETCLEKSLES